MKTTHVGFAAVLTIGLAFSSFMIAGSAEKLPVDKALYAKFLGNFTKTELPYTIQFELPKNQADLEKIYESDFSKDFGNELGSEFSAILPELADDNGDGFARRRMQDEPDNFYADAMLASNSQFSAVIYKRKPSFHMNLTSYTVATFDKKGKRIGEHRIDPYSEVLSVDKDLKINIKSYKVTQAEDAEKTLSYSLSEETQLQINAKGAIVALAD